MNHRHRKVLHALFSHPVSANIDFREVEAMLRELGATIDNRAGSRVGVTFGNHTAVFHHANHSVPKDEVAQIRKFLQTCGFEPAAYPM